MSRIVFRNVRKSYPRDVGQRWLRTLLNPTTIFKAVSGKSTERFEALRDVTFSVREGESVALIGRNGAGKSTILRLIAGLLAHDGGELTVEGRVSSMLDLGAGFHHDLTGRENLVINAALLGLSRRECRQKIGEMIEFSGLGDFIDEPLRTYSSGMWLRLSFAVATAVEPRILLIDEVLSVGDAAFQARCAERILELKNAGSIFLCVSHSAQIEEFCERAIWLDQGVVISSGNIGRVRAAYEDAVTGNCSIGEALQEPAPRAKTAAR